jgi:hypothetical protein
MFIDLNTLIYHEPQIFYFNGRHENYHQHTDTPDNLKHDLLEDRLALNTPKELKE